MVSFNRRFYNQITVFDGGRGEEGGGGSRGRGEEGREEGEGEEGRGERGWNIVSTELMYFVFLFFAVFCYVTINVNIRVLSILDSNGLVA